MNYWPCDVANLSECFQPYADWIQSIREVRVAATRKELNKAGWAIRGGKRTVWRLLLGLAIGSRRLVAAEQL